MIASGTAHSGMVAKLSACRVALEGGVGHVAIVPGKGVMNVTAGIGTEIVRTHEAMETK
jgi:acetylglutamate kinase